MKKNIKSLYIVLNSAACGNSTHTNRNQSYDDALFLKIIINKCIAITVNFDLVFRDPRIGMKSLAWVFKAFYLLRLFGTS